MILSGEFSIGETLPSERELASQLKVSRPVVHEGMIELSLRGLVCIKPRSGTIVNDFRKQGSIPLLLSLLNYHGTLDPKIQQGILEMRLLFETEMVSLCAKNHKLDALLQLEEIIKKEESIDQNKFSKVAELDYKFHQIIALASDNIIYSLLLNSFREIYLHLSTLFFSNPKVYPVVFNAHKKIVKAIRNRDEKEAVRNMTLLLNHGAEYLEIVINKNAMKNKVQKSN
jgi:DNA-binding FadR family transcriptional regulator